MYMVTYTIPYEGASNNYFPTLDEAMAYVERVLENDCMGEVKNLRLYKVELVEEFN